MDLNKLNELQHLILDLINEYDTQGYKLTEELMMKYEYKIHQITNENKIITKAIDLEPIKDETLAEYDYGTTGISPLLFK